MTVRVFIDCFDECLHELPRRKQRDAREVALHLAKAGRFSVFEATANQDIARTVTRVLASGWFATDKSCGFPWTKVSLTDRGRTVLLGVGAAEPSGAAP